MTEKQVKDYDKFVLRLPEGMREAIADLAKSNGRSMNAEIVQILKDALTHHSFDSIASKESLKNLPIDVRLGLIAKRTIIARAQIAKAMQDIDENLELLANKDAPISEEELGKIMSKPLYFDKDAAKRANERDLELKKKSDK
ncbi:Arc family DNA-binding protein [Atlantibacter hermannii]|uniref:Arc family DNA-binding protein n=1 Tax=Atlantibacter hermannii TaxID=565 RepID=UPI00289B8E40|nr:Arc family DNA-binding protein [Atlantibacter hermannii]